MLKFIILLLALAPSFINCNGCEGLLPAFTFNPPMYSIELKMAGRTADYGIPYTGTVTFEVDPAINLVYLYIDELKITYATIDFSPSIGPMNVDYYVREDYVVICLVNAPKGKLAKVEITYSGVFETGPSNDDVKFPYYSTFNTRTSVNITIHHHERNTVLASSIIEGKRSEVNQEQYVTTKFLPIFDIPNDLFNFYVGTLHHVETLPRHPAYFYTVSVYAENPNAISFSRGIANVSITLIRGFEQYLFTPYTLGKMDVVIQQGRLKEVSCGLFFLRENLLKSRKELLLSAAEKVAHQFFGCMMYPRQKEFIWLNRGLKNFLPYKIFTQMKPEEGFMDFMTIESLQYALREDVPKEGQMINSYFQSDVVIYNKAGSIFRMLNEAITDEKFRKGLMVYLKLYRMATPENFATSFHAINGRLLEYDNFFEILHSWFQMSGFPLLNVSTTEDGIVLKQSQYRQIDAHTHIWKVPVWIGPEVKWLDTNIGVFNKPKAYPDWKVATIGRNGFYRVNYTQNLWEAIIEKLKSSSFNGIPTEARARLIDDSMYFAMARDIDYSTAFDVLEYLEKETEYLPWATAYWHLKDLRRMAYESEVKLSIDAFIATKVQKIFHLSGLNDVPNELLPKRELRRIAIDLSGLAVNRVLSRSELFNLPNKHLDGVKYDEYNPSVCCNTVRHQEGNLSDILYRDAISFKPVNDPVGRKRRLYLNCLTCSNDPYFLKIFIVDMLQKSEYPLKLREKRLLPDLLLQNTRYEGKLAIIEALQAEMEDENCTYRVDHANYIKFTTQQLPKYITSPTLYKNFKLLIKSSIHAKIVADDSLNKVMAVPDKIEKWRKNLLPKIGERLKNYKINEKVNLVPTTVKPPTTKPTTKKPTPKPVFDREKCTTPCKMTNVLQTQLFTTFKNTVCVCPGDPLPRGVWP